MRTYETHIFDCDGVLIDSNGAKSAAFYKAALRYGEAAAVALVAYHQRAGSVGRRERLEYFFCSILQREPSDGEFDVMLREVNRLALAGVLAAPTVPGVVGYLERLDAKKLVVSGVETGELNSTLEAHGLRRYFVSIYGGLKRSLLREIDIIYPAVYYGDTLDDYESAKHAALDFVFVHGHTEFQNWQAYFKGKDVRLIQDFREALFA